AGRVFKLTALPALQTIYTHNPGLKVVSPATPYDAKGLLKSAIRDNNPVVFMEAEMMYSWEGEVPEGEYLIPLGKADVKRQGKDVSVVTYAKPLRVVQEAARRLAGQGIELEIIDLRTLRPLDTQTVFASVQKTNRCVVVDEAWPVCGMASYVGYLVAHHCFDDLDAPVETVTGEDVPMPYNHTLELAAQPSVEKVINAVKKVMYL
ncbi:MAG: transketolase C-terminal domain-containing protein, partial [Spirochaetia bacterium]